MSSLATDGSVPAPSSTVAATAGVLARSTPETARVRASPRRSARSDAGRSAIVWSIRAPRPSAADGAMAATGSARPIPNATPIATPITGSPRATLMPARAHTAQVSTKVVKPSPSSTP